MRSERSTVNKPVVMVDVVEPNVDAMEKVDLQVESTPGVYTVDVIEYTYVGRSIVYFCFAYIHKLAPYKLQHWI